MTEQWGPWIDHDGKGCPCKGMMVKVELRDGRVEGPFIAHSRGSKIFAGHARHDAWVHKPKPCDVIRYRIRKPKGMQMLEAILAEVKDKEYA